MPLLPDHEPELMGIHAIYLSRQHQPLALRLGEELDTLERELRDAGPTPPG